MSVIIPKLGPHPNRSNPNTPLPPDPVVIVAFIAKDEITLSFLHLSVSDNIDQNIETATTSNEA